MHLLSCWCVSIGADLYQDFNSPIISAPMTDATTPALVAAVINGGGMGLLGTGPCSIDFALTMQLIFTFQDGQAHRR